MDELEVWYLTETSWHALRYVDLVSAEERARAERFHRAQDAGRFLASRALLRGALAHTLGVSAAEVLFDSRCVHCADGSHGRLRMAVTPATPQTAEFSLTRAGSLVAVAVASTAVGLDAEPDRPGTGDLLDAPVFSAAERSWLRAAPRRFFELWVAKEAIGKVSGLGLVAADRVSVEPEGTDWRTAVDALGQSCWLAHLALPGMAAAAVAMYRKPCAVRVENALDYWLPG